MTVSGAMVVYFLAMLCSICYDIWTYEARQTRWEREMVPGTTYIRNYRKLTRKGKP